MNTTKSSLHRICLAMVLVTLVLAPLQVVHASCIPFDCADPQCCISLSPEAFVQQDLLPVLRDDDQAMALLDFSEAKYILLCDVLYLDGSINNLKPWNGELLAVCIPYKEGAMGSILYRFYAAQEPIKCALLWVSCTDDN